MKKRRDKEKAEREAERTMFEHVIYLGSEIVRLRKALAEKEAEFTKLVESTRTGAEPAKEEA